MPINPASVLTPLFFRNEWLRRLARMLTYAVLVGLVAFAGLLLFVRFWLVPRIEDYRPDIVSAMSRMLGHQVEIGALAAGWDGWNPTLTLADLRVIDGDGKTVLALPRVSNSVSWKSVLVFDLRLRSLEIERPQLEIRRDEQGMLHVAGLTIDPNERSDRPRLVDWLLRQGSITVREGLLTWQDDLRRAPQLVLDRVDFRLENSGARHRFGLSGTPPDELAAPLVLRGEVSGNSIQNWEQGSGKFYFRLDYADLAAWREWLPLPVEVAAGKGALRIWMDADQGTPTQIVADVELQGLRTRLREDLPELALDSLRGRLGWRKASGRSEFFTKALSLRGNEGMVLDATDFAFRQDGAEAPSRESEVTVNRVALEPLYALSRYMPLPQSVRDQLVRYAPRGVFEQATLHWRGELAHPAAWSIKTGVSQFGMNPVDALPGVANLSATLQATQEGGSVEIASRNMVLTLPSVFEQPVALDALQGKANWHVDQDGLRLRVSEASFSNSHAAGSASGEYRSMPAGPGWVDVSANITRADGRHTYDYLPVKLSLGLRQWLQRAIVAAEGSDAKLTLKGDLRQFPFVNDRGGIFQIDAKVKEGVLEFAPDWPRLEHIRANLKFHGARMDISSEEADTRDVHVGKVSVAIPDLAHARLLVQGEASDQTRDFLRYVDASPVAAMSDHTTEGMQATGAGRLALKLELPLAALGESRVSGEYEFLNNRLQVGGDVPELDQVNGKLLFSEKDVRANLSVGDLLGGPANVQVTTGAGAVHVGAGGTADLALLRKRNSTPLVRQLSGRSDWQLSLDLRGGDAQWSIESSLRGAAIDLPAPFAKAADATVPLKIVKTRNERQQELLYASYGSVAQLQVLRKAPAKGGEKPPVERATISFGGSLAEADRPGLWLTGKLDQIDVDRWLELKPWTIMSGDAAATSLPLGGGDLQISSLMLFGKRYANLHLNAGIQDRNWRLQVQGADMAGTYTWLASSPKEPNGKLVARMQRLKLPAPTAEEAKQPGEAAGAEASSSREWPALDVIAESFVAKNRELGRLELQAHPEEADWSVDKFSLVSPDGTLHATGHWRTRGRAQSTQLEVDVNAKDAGALLERYGYPHAITGASTTLKGQLAWDGPPQSFDYPSMSGHLTVEAGKGQFTKLDPGLGKLLGVLSLQALPRRITLDFHDVFSEGFAFDEIKGEVKVAGGVMSTNDFRISGPAARVQLAGDANLVRETQNLRVKVFPSLSAGAALGAAIVNPLLGGAVFLGSKVLKDPIDQIFAYEYRVSGTWSDPHVQKSNLAATAPKE